MSQLGLVLPAVSCAHLVSIACLILSFACLIEGQRSMPDWHAKCMEAIGTIAASTVSAETCTGLLANS